MGPDLMNNIRFIYRSVDGWSRRPRKKQMHRLGALLVATTIVALNAPNVARAEPIVSGEPVLNLSIQDGLIALDARDITVAAVLEAIGEQTGVIMITRAPLDQLITLSFSGRPVDEGLKRILGMRSYVMIYSDSPADGVAQSLAKVYIYGLQQPHTVSSAAHGTFALRRPKPAANVIARTTDPDPSIRRTAVRYLAKFDAPEAHVALINALNDQDSEVRLEALEVIGMLKPPIAIAALEIIKATNKNLEARELATDILDEIKGPFASEEEQPTAEWD